MAISPPNTTLSANDARILNALFDPETLPSSVAKAKDTCPVDAKLPPHPTIPQNELSTLEVQQNDIVQQSESSDPQTRENAWTELNAIVVQHPTYPSVYLNRAMLRRLKLGADSKSLFSAPESDITALFSDLSRAIQLSLPKEKTLSAPVSPYQARILRTAYSHRAYLYLKAAESGAEWKGKEKTELEELASRNFASAARFGDEVAREMSVRTNPYAKMCGAIVRNALAKEREEE